MILIGSRVVLQWRLRELDRGDTQEIHDDGVNDDMKSFGLF